MDVNEPTRPDPKVQIGALFDLGRVMVEHDLPAVDVQIYADVSSVNLTAYDHGRGGPATVADMLAICDAWAKALGADEYARHDHTTLHAGSWKYYASFHTDFAGTLVHFSGSVSVPVPLVRRSPRVRTAVSA